MSEWWSEFERWLADPHGYEPSLPVICYGLDEAIGFETRPWEPEPRVPRPCEKCGLMIRKRGPDPCLGYLPGVIQACCGHGVAHHAYVVVAPGYDPETGITGLPVRSVVHYYGSVAVEIISYLKAPYLKSP